MSNWYFHRGIPVDANKPGWQAPRGSRTTQRLAIYSPLPGGTTSAPHRPRAANDSLDAAADWLPHCTERLRRLARKAKAPTRLKSLNPA